MLPQELHHRLLVAETGEREGRVAQLVLVNVRLANQQSFLAHSYHPQLSIQLYILVDIVRGDSLGGSSWYQFIGLPSLLWTEGHLSWDRR